MRQGPRPERYSLRWASHGWWLALACSGLAAAEVLYVPADRDNVLYESVTGAISNGRGEYLFAGRTNQLQFSKRRVLVRFDLQTQVPPTFTIVGAELSLHLDVTASGQPEPVTVHRLLSNWGEGESRTQGGGGGGDTAEADDATWLHTYYDTALWLAPGGDFLPSASAVATVDSSTGSKTWSSQTLNDDVTHFFDHPDSNFGWVLLGNEDSAGSVRKFASRDHLDSTVHPSLKLYVLGDCPIARTGDVNGDHQITSSDIIVLVNFVFRAGSVPLPCAAAGDVNCNADVTSSDIIYTVNAVFKGGPSPCDVCDLIPVTWDCL